MEKGKISRKLKMFIMLLSFWLAAGLFQQPAQAAVPFTDVTERHSNYSDIMKIYEKGLISGYPDGTFRPSEKISRKHVAKLLERALELPPLTNSRQIYEDIPASHPYFTPIMKLTEAGIFSGDIDGRFNPEAPMTRIQMAKVLDTAFNFHMKMNFAFTDVQLFHWGYPHANALYSQGVMRGSNGELHPSQPVTRAHYATFLQRSIEAGKQTRNETATKDDVWDLANRLPLAIETILLEGKAADQPFENIQSKLAAYASPQFISDLRDYYPDVCVGCDVLLFPTLMAEPEARFDFTQTGNLITLKTFEADGFEGGPAAAGTVGYEFEKIDGRWKVSNYNFAVAGADHFRLTVEEARRLLRYYFYEPGLPPVKVSHLFSNTETAVDYETKETYEYEEYIFTIEMKNFIFDVYFASNSGLFGEY